MLTVGLVGGDKRLRQVLSFFGCNCFRINTCSPVWEDVAAADCILVLEDVGNFYAWKKLVGEARALVDFTGSYATCFSTKDSKFRYFFESPMTLRYETAFFPHRTYLEDSVDENLNPRIVQKAGRAWHTLVSTHPGDVPLLVFAPGKPPTVFSTLPIGKETDALSVRHLRRTDWLWRAIELACGTLLPHHRRCHQLSLRFDDVIGDCPFDFLEPLNEFGEVAHLAVDLDVVRPVFWERYLPRCAEVCLHAGSHYKYTPRDKTSLLYMQWDRSKEYALEDLESIFAKYLNFFHRIPPKKRSAVLSPHGWQVGKNAIPYLARYGGIRFILSPFMPGESFVAEEHAPADYYPFGCPGYHISKWHDMNFFFHASLHASLSRWDVGSLPYMLNEHDASSADFLFGLPLWNQRDGFMEPMEEIAERLARMREEAYIAGFPLVLFTHETTIAWLGEKGWRRLCDMIMESSSEYNVVPLSEVLSALSTQTTQ